MTARPRTRAGRIAGRIRRGLAGRTVGQFSRRLGRVYRPLHNVSTTPVPRRGEALVSFRQHLARATPARVLVVCEGREPDDLTDLITRTFSSADVTALGTDALANNHRASGTEPDRAAPDHLIQKLVDIAVTHGAFDLIIDMTEDPQLKQSLLARLFPLMPDDGQYVLEGVRSARAGSQDGAGQDVIWQYVSRLLLWQQFPLMVERLELDRDEVGLSRAIKSVEALDGAILLRKSGSPLVKLRDAHAREALVNRLGNGWGSDLEHRPAVGFQSRARVSSNRPDLRDSLLPAKLHVPERFLRRYDDVICAPGRLAIQGDILLPISFSRPLAGRIRNQNTRDVGYDVASVSRATMEPISTLAGAYYHLDTESAAGFAWPSADTLGRLWGWESAKREYPELRMIVGVSQGHTSPNGYLLKVLRACGVDPADVVSIDQPVRVEHLIGGTSMFHEGLYVHPDIEAVWARAREVLVVDAAPSRLFVASKDAAAACRNATELGQLFRQHGFDIEDTADPSDVTVAARVAQADIVAGFGGDPVLRNGAYGAGNGAWVIVTSDQQGMGDEYLFASVLADSYHHIWCSAEGSAGNRFAFDFGCDGQPLRDVLDAL